MLKVNCHGRARFPALSTSLPAPTHRHQQLPPHAVPFGSRSGRTRSLQIKAFLIVLPRLEKYCYPMTINVKVK